MVQCRLGIRDCLSKSSTVNGTVTTTSRDIVIVKSHIEVLQVKVPANDKSNKARRLKLLDSTVGKIEVYVGNRKVTSVTRNSVVNSWEEK